MLLRLTKHVTPAEREGLLRLSEELGYRPSYLDERRTLLELRLTADASAADRAPRARDRSLFEERAGVQAVLEHDEAPELHTRAHRTTDSIVAVADARFGGGAVSIAAGPCAVQDEERLVAIARRVRAAGATLLRGGAYKPRSSPYAFQGMGERGLERLAVARAETGLGIVTEVLDTRDVERVAGVADMLQIGSRSMSNAALLTEAGRSGKPVLLKRGLAATAREFLLAAEYVLSQGNERVVLCERGVRGFDHVTRNLLDVGTVAYLKGATHLPVVVDPSHAAGRTDLVLPLARAGVAAGADGVLVEVHPEPAETRSDGDQALSYALFDELVQAVRGLVELDGRRLITPRHRTAPLVGAGAPPEDPR